VGWGGVGGGGGLAGTKGGRAESELGLHFPENKGGTAKKSGQSKPRKSVFLLYVIGTLGDLG